MNTDPTLRKKVAQWLEEAYETEDDRACEDLAGKVLPGYDMISYYGQSNGSGGSYLDFSNDGDGRDADAPPRRR